MRSIIPYFLFLLHFFLLHTSLHAQSDGISYQLVAKERNGSAAANKNIRVKASILNSPTAQSGEYTELHVVKTNESGVFGIVIGTGSILSGSFNAINWGSSSHYLKVDIDPDGGYDFISTGTFQFLSVPYALYAKTAAGFNFNKVLSKELKEGINFDFIGGKGKEDDTYRGIAARVEGINVNGSNTAIFGEYAGQSSSSDAVKSQGFGLRGAAQGADFNCGVYGETNGIGDYNYGLYGYASGKSASNNYGVLGHAVFSSGNNYAVYGKAIGRTSGKNYGVYGTARGGADNFAGYFDGKTRITQSLCIGNAVADSLPAFALGNRAKAFGRHSMAIGDSVLSSGASAVSTGFRSKAEGSYSFAGGYNSNAEGIASFAYGTNNTAMANGSVSFGNATEAKGINSFAGGEECVSNYRNSFVFGKKSYTYGNNAIAFGYMALAKTASFVFSDSSSEELLEGDENTFNVRASEGIYLYTSPNLSSGVQLAAGSGSWQSLSDSTKKEHFQPMDAEATLKKVSLLPVRSWNYKAQNPSIRHIGPTAQDFYTAFQVGENNTTITTSDIDGVNMLAIQALEKRSTMQQNTISQLQKENEDLKARLAKIEALLNASLKK